jgi:hypothetical protein
LCLAALYFTYTPRLTGSGSAAIGFLRNAGFIFLHRCFCNQH